jgi:hypothetical protein
VIQRVAPSLEASQMAWSRTAKRWGELTSPASRTDPALVGAASEVRADIAATATNQAGWATPDQLASRLEAIWLCHASVRLGIVKSVSSASRSASRPARASRELAALDARSGTPALRHPRVVASQGAIGSGSVRPTYVNLKLRRSNA